MRFINRTTLSALIAVGALVVAGCGDEDTGSSASSSAVGNGVDRAFVADMIPHHESALEMAKIAQQRGESTFAQQLADDIATSQSKEISTMRSEDKGLDTAGVKRGSLGVPNHMKGMDSDPAKLKTAEPFDPTFIKMMIPHHEGAIEMAKVEIAKGEDPQLKALAQDIIDAQQREITAMRKQPGGTASSDGGMKDDGHGGHSG